jgi:adenine-specific DNA-methyltransferase
MDKPGEPPSRRFLHEGNGRRSDDHMIHTFWRNAWHLRDPEVFAQMLRRVPFLNGGLFECLDERVQKGNSALTEEVRIDGFSNDPGKHPKLPNYLFFGPDRIEDLSSAYGDPGRRRETVRPLLSILRSYNFTLTENTPFDQEVALDPELLGHVFENLLAAFNPETGTVARKATGSF